MGLTRFLVIAAAGLFLVGEANPTGFPSPNTDGRSRLSLKRPSEGNSSNTPRRLVSLQLELSKRNVSSEDVNTEANGLQRAENGSGIRTHQPGSKFNRLQQNMSRSGLNSHSKSANVQIQSTDGREIGKSPLENLILHQNLQRINEDGENEGVNETQLSSTKDIIRKAAIFTNRIKSVLGRYNNVTRSQVSQKNNVLILDRIQRKQDSPSVEEENNQRSGKNTPSLLNSSEHKLLPYNGLQSEEESHLIHKAAKLTNHLKALLRSRLRNRNISTATADINETNYANSSKNSDNTSKPILPMGANKSENLTDNDDKSKLLPHMKTANIDGISAKINILSNDKNRNNNNQEDVSITVNRKNESEEHEKPTAEADDETQKAAANRNWSSPEINWNSINDQKVKNNTHSGTPSTDIKLTKYNIQNDVSLPGKWSNESVETDKPKSKVEEKTLEGNANMNMNLPYIHWNISSNRYAEISPPSDIPRIDIKPTNYDNEGKISVPGKWSIGHNEQEIPKPEVDQKTQTGNANTNWKLPDINRKSTNDQTVESNTRSGIPSIDIKQKKYNSEHKVILTGELSIGDTEYEIYKPVADKKTIEGDANSNLRLPEINWKSTSDQRVESSIRSGIPSIDIKQNNYNSEHKVILPGEWPIGETEHEISKPDAGEKTIEGDANSNLRLPEINWKSTSDQRVESSNPSHMPRIDIKQNNYNSDHKVILPGEWSIGDTEHEISKPDAGEKTIEGDANSNFRLPEINWKSTSDQTVESNTRSGIPSIDIKQNNYNSEHKVILPGEWSIGDTKHEISKPDAGEKTIEGDANSNFRLPEINWKSSSDQTVESNTRSGIPSIDIKQNNYNSEHKVILPGEWSVGDTEHEISKPEAGEKTIEGDANSNFRLPEINWKSTSDHTVESNTRSGIPSIDMKQNNYNSEHKVILPGEWSIGDTEHEISKPEINWKSTNDQRVESSTRSGIPSFDIKQNYYNSEHKEILPGEWSIGDTEHEVSKPETGEKTIEGDVNSNLRLPEINWKSTSDQTVESNTRSGIPSIDIKRNNNNSEHKEILPGEWPIGDTEHEISKPETGEKTIEGGVNSNFRLPEINWKSTSDQTVESYTGSGIPSIDIKQNNYNSEHKVILPGEWSIGDTEHEVSKPETGEKTIEGDVNSNLRLPEINWKSASDQTVESSNPSHMPRIDIKHNNYNSDHKVILPGEWSIGDTEHEISKPDAGEKTIEGDVNSNLRLPEINWKSASDQTVESSNPSHMPRIDIMSTNNYNEDEVSPQGKWSIGDNKQEINKPGPVMDTPEEDANLNWRLPESNWNRNSKLIVGNNHRFGTPSIDVKLANYDYKYNISIPGKWSIENDGQEMAKSDDDQKLPKGDANTNWRIPEINMNSTNDQTVDSNSRSGMPNNNIKSANNYNEDEERIPGEWSIRDIEHEKSKTEAGEKTPDKETKKYWWLPEIIWTNTNDQTVEGRTRTSMPSIDITPNIYNSEDDLSLPGKWVIGDVERKMNKPIAGHKTLELDDNTNRRLPEINWNSTNDQIEESSTRSGIQSIDNKPNNNISPEYTNPTRKWSIEGARGDELEIPKPEAGEKATKGNVNWNWLLPKINLTTTNDQNVDPSPRIHNTGFDVKPHIYISQGEVNQSGSWLIGGAENDIHKPETKTTIEANDNLKWESPDFNWDITYEQEIHKSPGSGTSNIEIMNEKNADSGDTHQSGKWSIRGAKYGITKPEADEKTPERNSKWNWRLPNFNWNTTNDQKLDSSPRSVIPSIDIKPTNYNSQDDMIYLGTWALGGAGNGIPKPEADSKTKREDSKWNWSLPNFNWNTTNNQKVDSSPRSRIPSIDIKPTNYNSQEDMILPGTWALGGAGHGILEPEADEKTKREDSKWNWRLPDYNWNTTNDPKVDNNPRSVIPSIDIKPIKENIQNDMILPETWSLKGAELGIPQQEVDEKTKEKYSKWNWSLPNFNWNTSSDQKVDSSPRSGIPSSDIKPNNYNSQDNIILPGTWSLEGAGHGIPKPEADAKTKVEDIKWNWWLPDFNWNTTNEQKLDSGPRSGIPSIDIKPTYYNSQDDMILPGTWALGGAEHGIPKPEADAKTKVEDSKWNWRLPDYNWNTTNDPKVDNNPRSVIPSIDIKPIKENIQNDMILPETWSLKGAELGIPKPEADEKTKEKDSKWNWSLPNFNCNTSSDQKVDSSPRSGIPSSDIKPNNYNSQDNIILPGTWSLEGAGHGIPKPEADEKTKEDSKWHWRFPDINWSTANEQTVDSSPRSGIPSIFIIPTKYNSQDDMILPGAWSLEGAGHGIPKPEADAKTKVEDIKWNWWLPDFNWNTTNEQKLDSSPRSGIPSIDIKPTYYNSQDDMILPGTWTLGGAEHGIPKPEADAKTKVEDIKWNWWLPDFNWNTTNEQKLDSSPRSRIPSIDIKPTYYNSQDDMILPGTWALGGAEHVIPKPEADAKTKVEDIKWWNWWLPDFNWNTTNEQKLDSSPRSGIPSIDIKPTYYNSQDDMILPGTWALGGAEHGIPKPEADAKTKVEDIKWNWWLPDFNWNTTNEQKLDSSPRSGIPSIDIKPTYYNSQDDMILPGTWALGGAEHGIPKPEADAKTKVEDIKWWNWWLPDFNWNTTNEQKLDSSPRSGIPSIDIKPTYYNSQDDMILPGTWALGGAEHGIPKPEADAKTKVEDIKWYWWLPDFNWNTTNEQKLDSSPRSGIPSIDIIPTKDNSPDDVKQSDNWSIGVAERFPISSSGVSEKYNRGDINISVPFSLRGIWNFRAGFNSSINIISLNFSSPQLITTGVNFSTTLPSNFTNLQFDRSNNSMKKLVADEHAPQISIYNFWKAISKKNATFMLVNPDLNSSSLGKSDDEESKETMLRNSNWFWNSLSILKYGLNTITKD